MNTPTQMNRLSASSCGITPSATLSATALATACWAGPNICTACLAPLMVTLLNSTVGGLASRLGATTASNEVNPSLLLVRQFANAVSAALPRGPMMRSIWATSLPSPTSDSPTQSWLIFAIAISSQGNHNAPQRLLALRAQIDCLSLLSASGLNCRTGLPDSCGIPSRWHKSTTLALLRQDSFESVREQSGDCQIGACPGIDAVSFEGGVPTKNVREHRLGMLRRLKRKLKPGSRLADLFCRGRTVFSHDMRIWKR